MLNINDLYVQMSEHFQVFNILKREIWADIMAEGCRMNIGLWLERSSG